MSVVESRNRIDRACAPAGALKATPPDTICWKLAMLIALRTQTRLERVGRGDVHGFRKPAVGHEPQVPL